MGTNKGMTIEQTIANARGEVKELEKVANSYATAIAENGILAMADNNLSEREAFSRLDRMVVCRTYLDAVEINLSNAKHRLDALEIQAEFTF